ncbi:MAG: 3-isopropylmalate dehydrogenase [Chloroflexi bacterium]|nr:3-isopropylmalate dehydrogenase [Chloroflexota bacterium]
MEFKITVLGGDGIGPDVVAESIKVLDAVGKKYGHKFNFEKALLGGVAIEATGQALPEQTLRQCLASDAVLLGAVGDPKYDSPNAPVKPESGLLAIRQGLGLFANIRPVKMFSKLVNSTALKPEIVKDVDMVFVRELTGSVYFATPKKRFNDERGRGAVDTMQYHEDEIERILRVGFELARKRSKKLTSIDKANVLKSSQLWREIAEEVKKDYPDVTLNHVLVDAASMYLISRPSTFDVLVTENMFGDILTDEASMLAGSMGMLPSASLAGIPSDNTRCLGLYEPCHGSAPDITGLGIANPIATILSAAMMLRYSLALPKEADAIEKAVNAAIADGLVTKDIAQVGQKYLATGQMGSAVADKI